jgi:hypothetical protein
MEERNGWREEEGRAKRDIPVKGREKEEGDVSNLEENMTWMTSKSTS